MTDTLNSSTVGAVYFSGTESEKRYVCYKCNEELVFDVKIGRRDMCPNCTSYLHCCFNCNHWDVNAHNQCKENQGEFIRDRSEGNFCGYFDFRTIDDNESSEAVTAKDKLNSLFGGEGPKKVSVEGFKPSPTTENDARSRLEQLFKK